MQIKRIKNKTTQRKLHFKQSKSEYIRGSAELFTAFALGGTIYRSEQTLTWEVGVAISNI